jgi:protein-tyrosine phosphatase
MVEAFMTRWFARAGINAVVDSAGASAAPGAPPLDEVVKVMLEFGVDVTEHQSKLLVPERVGKADLVIGLTREHLREAVVLEPEVFERSFTLKELVRRGHERGARPSQSPLRPWLEWLLAGRRIDDLLGASSDDDVADPLGHSYAAFRQAASELCTLSKESVSLLWPSSVGS